MRKERFGTYRAFYEILKTLDFKESIENKFGKSRDTDTYLFQELVWKDVCSWEVRSVVCILENSSHYRKK